MLKNWRWLEVLFIPDKYSCVDSHTRIPILTSRNGTLLNRQMYKNESRFVNVTTLPLGFYYPFFFCFSKGLGAYHRISAHFFFFFLNSNQVAVIQRTLRLCFSSMGNKSRIFRDTLVLTSNVQTGWWCVACGGGGRSCSSWRCGLGDFGERVRLTK